MQKMAIQSRRRQKPSQLKGQIKLRLHIGSLPSLVILPLLLLECIAIPAFASTDKSPFHEEVHDTTPALIPESLHSSGLALGVDEGKVGSEPGTERKEGREGGAGHMAVRERFKGQQIGAVEAKAESSHSGVEGSKLSSPFLSLVANLTFPKSAFLKEMQKRRVAEEVAAIGSWNGLESSLTSNEVEGMPSLNNDGHEEWVRRRMRSRGIQCPSFRKCSIIVAKDGTGSFRKVQDALNHIAGSFFNARKRTTRICIRPGKYVEVVHVRQGQNHVEFVGCGRRTVISAGNTQSKTDNPFMSATLVVEGDYFSASGLVVENTAKSTWDPAPAVAVLGKRSVWRDVALLGWVDTVGIFTSQHFFHSVLVSGITDVIWGFGRAEFVKSEVYSRKFPSSIEYVGSITAMGTDWPSQGISAGVIFWASKIVGNGLTYLGRPYRAKVTVAFVMCYLGRAVVDVGWIDWNGAYDKGNVHFGEYRCIGPKANSRKRKMARVVRRGGNLWQLTPKQYIGYPW